MCQCIRKPELSLKNMEWAIIHPGTQQPGVTLRDKGKTLDFTGLLGYLCEWILPQKPHPHTPKVSGGHFDIFFMTHEFSPIALSWLWPEV